jgi:hypothetical protein
LPKDNQNTRIVESDNLCIAETNRVVQTVPSQFPTKDIVVTECYILTLITREMSGKVGSFRIKKLKANSQRIYITYKKNTPNFCF